MSMNNRIEQLDSIRGLASLTVVFSHLVLVTTIPAFSILFANYSPLRILTNGHSAVVMFFVLSGFVLFLPFQSNKPVSYRAFLIKRITRIYIPYLVAITLSILACSILSTGSIRGLSEWFNNTWNKPVNLKSIVENVMLIGNYNSDLYNNVIWSLVHEMRISILFPFLAFLLIRLNWKMIVGICLGLSLISGLNQLFLMEFSYGYRTSFMDTVHFISMFLIGGLLAKHKEDLLPIYRKLTRINKMVILLSSLVLYNYSGAVKIIGELLGIHAFGDISKDYVATAGSFVLILIALGSQKAMHVLLNRPIRLLGALSYSLYLYHLPILFSLMYLYHSVLPMMIIYLLTIIISLPVAALSYRYIELPAIAFGKTLTSRIRGSNLASNNAVVLHPDEQPYR